MHPLDGIEGEVPLTSSGMATCRGIWRPRFSSRGSRGYHPLASCAGPLSARWATLKVSDPSSGSHRPVFWGIAGPEGVGEAGENGGWAGVVGGTSGRLC